ncbi:MAG: polysaccharide pyruvyl transferase family protein [Spirochaetes bacterium]|nr:polysaccharide pyruvyl transferase family protein [Spirochaetota bacterium]
MKKIFLNGFLGYKNFGDDLLFDQALKFLPFSKKDLYYLAGKKGRYLQETYLIKRFSRYNFLKLLLFIQKGDVLINLGGIFQDITSLKSFLYYFMINFIFIIKGGILVSLSIDGSDLSSGIAIFLGQYIIKKSFLVVFREKSNLFKEAGHIYSASDLAFLMKAKRSKIKKKYTVIILKPCTILRNIIDFYKKIKDTLLIIMPEDKIYFKAYLCKNFWIYNGCKDDLIQRVRSARFVVSMRYHPAVVALKHRIPVILIGKEKKIINLANEFNIPFIRDDDKKVIDKLKSLSYIKNYKIKANTKVWIKVHNELKRLLK